MKKTIDLSFQIRVAADALETDSLLPACVAAQTHTGIEFISDLSRNGLGSAWVTE